MTTTNETKQTEAERAAEDVARARRELEAEIEALRAAVGKDLAVSILLSAIARKAGER